MRKKYEIKDREAFKRAIHKFTEDECARGGAEARQRERQAGIPRNHGVRFGKKVTGG